MRLRKGRTEDLDADDERRIGELEAQEECLPYLLTYGSEAMIGMLGHVETVQAWWIILQEHKAKRMPWARHG